MDSVIFVTVRSRLAGKKFLTPLMRFSKLAPTPDSLRRSVSLLEMLLKPRKSSVEVEDCWVVLAGVEVIMVIRVVARTLRMRMLERKKRDKNKNKAQGEEYQ